MTEEKRSVLFTIPDNRLKAQLFDAKNIAEISRLYHAEWNLHDRELTPAELAAALRGKDAVVTAWGSPPLTREALDQADRLRFVGHTGGTIKWLVDEDFFLRGIPVVSANAALAPAISEYCLMVSLMGAWNIMGTVDTVRRGGWLTNEDVTDGLRGKTVGIVGYGVIAREYIRLLQPFAPKVLVYSGHCGKEEAEANNFELASIEDALSCDIVSLHSTLNAKTEGMIDASRLALIRDGAIFINTARARLVDETALMAELRTGRFTAVIDVFHEEPIAPNHPLRSLPNVIATPHIAGCNRYWRRKQSDIVLEDMARCFRGERLEHQVTLEQYKRLTPV